MDIQEQQELIRSRTQSMINEEIAGLEKPNTKKRAKQQMNWLDKQVRQMQKTIELDGATHSREMKELLRAKKKAYAEEYKRIRDAVEDGEIK